MTDGDFSTNTINTITDRTSASGGLTATAVFNTIPNWVQVCLRRLHTAPPSQQRLSLSNQHSHRSQKTPSDIEVCKAATSRLTITSRKECNNSSPPNFRTSPVIRNNWNPDKYTWHASRDHRRPSLRAAFIGAYLWWQSGCRWTHRLVC